MILAVLAAQMLPSAPLPAEMEATPDPYVECVQQGFVAGLEREGRLNSQAQPDGSGLMSKAIVACADVRARAVASSERALEHTGRFKEPGARRAFVREFFDSLDGLMRWSVTPEGDPDNWNKDAED